MKKLSILALVAALACGASAQELTEAQANELIEVGQGFAQQATVFESLMQNKLTELAVELQREGRLDDEKAAAKSAKKTNAIMTDLGSLYGEYIKTKVQYVLKAKNTLTDEQKLYMLEHLNPSDSLPYETLAVLQPEAFDLPLNLSVEQEKKLIAIEAALLIKEVELERDVELVLLDLRQVLMSGQPAPDQVDPAVMKLADLAAQSIANRVQFFLKSKDVLTLDQKRLLTNMLGLD